MEENKIKKIGFFKRIKISIFNLENYKIFIEEKFSKALKYLLLLIVIATAILSVASTIKVSEEFSKFANYIKTDFPDFEFKDGKLEVSKKVESYDKEYDARLIVDTSGNVNADTLEEYKEKSKESVYSVILLRDKMIYTANGLDGKEYETSYTNISNMLGINEINKEQLLEKYFNSNMKMNLNLIIYVYAFITIFMMNIITILEDVLIVALFRMDCCKTNRSGYKSFSSSITCCIFFNVIYYFKYNIFSSIFSCKLRNKIFFDNVYDNCIYLYDCFSNDNERKL